MPATKIGSAAAVSSEIDVCLEAGDWGKAGFDVESLVRTVASATLGQADLPSQIRGKPLEMVAVLSDDDDIRALNRDYRGFDKPTNVLSFATLDGPDAAEFLKVPGSFHIGDIILSYSIINQEARDLGIDFRDHLIHLVMHGTLHLLGYDHETDAEAVVMETLEIRLLAEMDIKNPYDL